MASIPIQKPPHTVTTSWKGVQMTPNHESIRIIAHTTAAPITYTYKGLFSSMDFIYV